jgi:hypothetical protein
MTWNLSGKMVENCTCNMLCPCWFGVKELMIMDQGYCAAPILFRIQNGNVDGIDLKGRNIVVLFDFRVQQYSMAMLLLDFISMRQLMKANAKI